MKIEREMLIGLIVSDWFIKIVKSHYSPNLIQSKVCRLLIGEILKYEEKYGKAPKSSIQAIYDRLLRTQGEREDITKAERLLQSISDEYLQRKKNKNVVNLEHLCSLSIEYLNKRKIEILSEELQILAESNRLNEAKEKISQFKTISESGEDIVKPLGNREVIQAAFEEQYDPVIIYPGSLGKMMNSSLVKGGFVSYIAPTKRGKSFWLLDGMIRALRNEKKVVMFQAGDMTRNQQIRRLGSYLTRIPTAKKYCGKYLSPVLDCMRNQNNSCKKEERTCKVGVIESEEGDLVEFETAQKYGYKPCIECLRNKEHKEFFPTTYYEQNEIKHPLTWKQTLKATDDFIDHFGNFFHLSTHPNGTLTLDHINETIDRLEQEESFLADMIVIDYADLLITTNRKYDPRHQENEKWKGLRALSQAKNCLVLTATQSGRDSIYEEHVKLTHVSEDIRKTQHVTAMFALNQKREEKKKGIMRVTSLVARDDDFDELKEIKVLQDLRTSRPFITSFISKEIQE